jgi:hypothetical protein
MPEQRDWRFCHKCVGLFFNGRPDKGICPRGGGHEAAGFNFVLPHTFPFPNAQADWRFCHKCVGLFFDGRPDKGICSRGGTHEAAGLVFVLPHDVQQTQIAQANWRFCHKCVGLFFDGRPDKGICPRGGGHEAAGFNFVLPHPIFPAIRLTDESSRVKVDGSQFTPDEHVHIFFRFDTEFGQTSNPTTPLVSTTDTNGFLISVTFPLQSGSVTHIGVKAIDVRTNQFAEAFLRGGA